MAAASEATVGADSATEAPALAAQVHTTLVSGALIHTGFPPPLLRLGHPGWPPISGHHQLLHRAQLFDDSISTPSHALLQATTTAALAASVGFQSYATYFVGTSPRWYSSTHTHTHTLTSPRTHTTGLLQHHPYRPRAALFTNLRLPRKKTTARASWWACVDLRRALPRVAR